MVSPYLPDIIEGVVARVNTTFETRTTDPFNVFFDKGIYSQVGRNVAKKNESEVWPMIWLVFPFVEARKDYSIWGDDVCDILIAMPSTNTYTQQERDDLVFKPFLLPIYDEFIKQISAEKSFHKSGAGAPPHTRIVRPYWGGGDVGSGGDTDNLFKKKIDAIQLRGLALKMKLPNCVGTGAFAFSS